MANVCSACGSAHCLRFNGDVCMHTRLQRKPVDHGAASLVGAGLALPSDPAPTRPKAAVGARQASPKARSK